MFDILFAFFFFSSRRGHTRCSRDWSSDVCSSDVTTSQTGVYPADWKPYTVYDLYSSYRATDQLTLRLAMENVTDRAYLVPLGDVLAFTLVRGRTLQGTVEYQF